MIHFKEYLPNSLIKVLQKVRLVIDYYQAFIVLKKRKNVHPLSKEDNIVVFDLQDPQLDRNYGRYTYLLIKFFSLNGWSIVLKDALTPVANLKRLRYKNWLIKIPSLHVLTNPSFQKAFYVYDDFADKNITKYNQKAIQLKDMEHGNTKDCDFHFPFTMHPFFYEKERYLQAEALREGKRSVKILFSGKMDAYLYTKKVLKDRYHVLNRIEVVRALQNNLSDKEMMWLESSDEFETLSDDTHYRNQLVIGERIIKIGRWLEGLSQSDFFLACPGTDMPMCHNIIEAMSVGSIPIIEFPEQMNPPLQHGVNCLAFSGENGLINTVRQVLKMDQESLQPLRQGVIEYYDRFLSPEKVVSNITNFDKDKLSICLEMS